MVRFRSRALPLLAALLLSSPPLFAQADQALAETLFQEGRRLMDAGKYAEACPKLQESQRLDPGTGTLLNLGRCLREVGKPASAWVVFNQAVASARAENRADRIALAQSEIKKLEEMMPRLSVVVPPEADVQGLSVTLDSQAITPAARGVASPVDPGDHRISASAPGRKTWTNTLTVRPGAQTHTVVIPVLEPGNGPTTGEGQSAGLAPPPASGAAVQEPLPAEPPPPMGGLRPIPPRPKRFVLGLRLNAAIPLGTFANTNDGSPSKFNEWTKAQGGIWFEGGYKITPQFMLGGYLVVNGGGAGSVWRAEPAPTCGGSTGGSCTAIDVRIGLQGQYAFLAESKTHPWVGAGIGYELWSLSVDGSGRGSYSIQGSGAEWLLLQGGADFELGNTFGLGPFMAFSLGRFTSASLTCDGCTATEFDIDDPAFHSWLTLGARGVFSL